MLVDYYKINGEVYVDKGYYAYCLFPGQKFDRSEVLKKLPYKVLFVRYSETIMSSPFSREWYYVIKEGSEKLEDYSGNLRKLIRRGLRNFTFKKFQLESYFDDFYEVYRKGNIMFDNAIQSKQECLRQHEYEMANIDIEVEYFGAFENEKLVGYCKNFLSEKCVFYETSFVLPQIRKRYVNYGLFHSMNKYYLNELNLQYATNGSRNLLHESNIQDFLISKFKYRKAYFNLRVSYRLWFGLLIRLLYPFKWTLKINNVTRFKSLEAVLEQERLRRLSALHAFK